MEGGTRIELAGITYVNVMSMLVASNINRQPIISFVLTILVEYFAIQFPSSIPSLAFGLTIIVITKFMKNRPGWVSSSRHLISMMRTALLVQTTISILLCDFPFWHSRFSKTKYYGISLMDLGVGGFVINFALVSSRISFSKGVSGCLINLCLGLIRLATIKIFNLKVDPTEYGIHWNFYFTMAVLNAVVLPLLRYTSHKVRLSIGISILGIHEILVLLFSELIFTGHRKTFIMQNREGMSNLPAYIAISLIVSVVGDKIINAIFEWKTLLVLFFSASSFGIVHLAASQYSVPSRRLMNLAYSSWILFYYVGFMAFTGFVLCFSRFNLRNEFTILFVGRNPLLVFLFSNLLVLLFKVCFDLERMGLVPGTFLFIVYLMANFLILPYFSKWLKLEKDIQKE